MFGHAWAVLLGRQATRLQTSEKTRRRGGGGGGAELCGVAVPAVCGPGLKNRDGHKDHVCKVSPARQDGAGGPPDEVSGVAVHAIC